MIHWDTTGSVTCNYTSEGPIRINITDGATTTITYPTNNLKWKECRSYSIEYDTNYIDTTCYTDNTSAWKTITTGVIEYSNNKTWRQVNGGINYSTHEGNFYIKDSWYHTPNPEDRMKHRLRAILDSRRGPGIIIKQNDRRKALSMPEDIREQRARETLRRVIGDKKFFNFLKSGFLSVKAKSGLIYQIFPGHGITCVFKQGQLVEKLCVVLQGGFPPTDSLIMRYLLILNNEQTFRGYAISHFPRAQVYQEDQIDMRPLTEIYKELKRELLVA